MNKAMRDAIECLLVSARELCDMEEVSADAVRDLGVALSKVEPFFEDTDPRSMGWVGDDGLP